MPADIKPNLKGLITWLCSYSSGLEDLQNLGKPLKWVLVAQITYSVRRLSRVVNSSDGKKKIFFAGLAV